MKKIFSLLMVAAIVLTMSFAAMAAEPVKGMHTIITETDSDITVTVKVGNVVGMSGMTTYIKSNAVKYVAGSFARGEKLSGFEVFTDHDTSKTGYVKLVLGTNVAANYITDSGEFVALTYKVEKVDPSKELSTADFTYDTFTTRVSKITTSAEGTVAGVAAGNNFTSGKQASFFTVEYVDDRTKDDPTPSTPSYEATEDEVNATQDWTSGEFKYPTDKVGGTDNAAVGKKVAAFGKAGTALTNGNYGIKIGNRFYPGRIDVPQGSYFAIIVVNTNGDDAIEDSYTYDIYTGTDAAPTWVATGLSAVVE